MSSINDGMPAFPIPLHPGESYQGHAPCDGMTLRDYFAAKAMQASLSRGTPVNTEAMAKTAYAYADAMIKAREP